ncbi:MAG: sensor histidine kinase [Albidovulum sp.]
MRGPDRLPGPVGVWVLIGVLFGIAAVMFTLGRSVIRAYERAQLSAAADAGSIFVEGILAPHAYDLLKSVGMDREISAELGRVVREISATRHFAAINVWDAKGALLYASRPYDEIEAHDPEDLNRALAGEVVVTLATETDTEGESPILPPFLEVYAPIRAPDTGDLVAVGEIYIDAASLVADRKGTEQAIWLSVTLAAFALVFLTGVVAYQRRKLVERYADLARTSAENLALLQKADAARAAAVRSNEALLHDIGAALHDGPLQMLTVAALAEGTTRSHARVPPQASSALQEAVAQLRQIAAGLILPEISGLSANEAIRLATARHAWLTGVHPSFEDLPLAGSVPESIRICLYRVALEGLANAYRHAPGASVAVRARVAGNRVTIEVENDPPHRVARSSTATGDEAARPRLGLEGLRHRIDALGGSLLFIEQPDGGAILRADLPLTTAPENPGGS